MASPHLAACKYGAPHSAIFGGAPSAGHLPSAPGVLAEWAPVLGIAHGAVP